MARITGMSYLEYIALALIFLGGLGAILLTIGQTRRASNDKSEIITTTKTENQELRKRLQELKDERNDLHKILEERDQNISKQNEAILSLNNRISDQSKEIAGYQTGGDSYILFQIYNDFHSGNLMALEMGICGKYPMRNVDIIITDNKVIKGSRKEMKIDPQYAKNTQDNIESYLRLKFEYFAKYESNTVVYLEPEHYGKDLDFTIMVRSENGRTDQRISMGNFRDNDYAKFKKSSLVREGNVINTSPDLICN